jgi:hypothetical protein
MSYAARGGSRTALWLWRPNGRELTALNALGTRLGAQEPAAAPVRKRPATAPATPARRPPAASKPKQKSAAAKAKPAAKRAATKTAATKRRVKAATTAKPAAKRAKPAPKRPRPEPRQAPTLDIGEKQNGRVPIPSWDSVLLGVASPAGGRRRS